MSEAVRRQKRVNSVVLAQHAEEAAGVHASRTMLTVAAQVSFDDLQRFDERIAAHLDGLAIGGDASSPICDTLLENPFPGALFVAAARAIEMHDEEKLDRLLALAEAMPEISGGLRSAFGWSGRDKLQGLVAGLLAHGNPFRRTVGIAASAMHRVDPGVIAFCADGEAVVRARALRTAGELGNPEYSPIVARSLASEDADCQYWAARSAVLLGNRDVALTMLTSVARAGDPLAGAAAQLALLAMPVADAHELLRQLAAESVPLRNLIRGAAFCGDPTYVPWLIGQMAEEKHARVAGESLTMILGVNLAQPDFQREAPADLVTGPTDEPEDDNVDLDEDDGLPWPDQAKVQAWWNQNGARFTTGVRHLMGTPPNRTHCIEVLKTGYQRQRIAAAYHLCLLNPGTPLFEWRAPAWRQQRELAQTT